jgi:hypothetical protein
MQESASFKLNHKPGANSAYERFIYAISTEATMEQYSRHMKAFLKFAGIQKDTLEDGTNELYEIASKDTSWLRDWLIVYLTSQKNRLLKKEISSSTLRNLCKPIKLFCDMNDILINGRLIKRGMPPTRKASTDRPPNLEEVR